MTVRLEHANLTVRDIDAEIAFLRTAFPDFRVRGQGVAASGMRWVHVGTSDTYLALTQGNRDDPGRRGLYSGAPGWNHLGYEVDDVDALRERMLRAGYRESTTPVSHRYRLRAYFYDPEGNDWEFVQYLTDDRGRRNDYDSD